MVNNNYELNDGRLLHIREVTVADAAALLQYIGDVSGESDFLTFGPGEVDRMLAQEEDFIRNSLEADNQLFIQGSIGETIVSVLHFSGGSRPRLRHSGEFGMSVRKPYWGLGIGSLILDTLIAWARATQIVKKINLRTRTDNQRAILLYEGKGFLNEGTIRSEIFIDGTYYDLHWMGLEL